MPKDAANSALPPPGNPLFSAVLLAGGKSSRMGFDKATAAIDGQPLWRRQMTMLQALGPHELFISGKSDGPYAGQEFEIVPDVHPDCGPLGGLETACQRMQTSLLCVLGVDLPRMTAPYLSRLVQLARQTQRGVVPRNGESFEPLVAVYPQALLPIISQQLGGSDYSLQRLVRQALEMDLVVPVPVELEEQELFRNLNTPADLAGL